MISVSTKRLLQISFLPGIGSKRLQKVISLAEKEGIESISNDNVILDKFNYMRNGKQGGDRSDEVLKSCEYHNIHILSPLDDEYPDLLKLIDDYPPLIYVKGNIPALSKIGCSVVGTREASELGSRWSTEIAEELVKNRYTVISGLARGIDTAAHKGALNKNGITIAVLAHGLDTITPTENREFANTILENYGTLISEHPPGVPPRSFEYARRNRIQSGLSVCSFMVESKKDGGTIHHVDFALKQKRNVYFAMPTDTSGEFEFGGAKKLYWDGNSIGIYEKRVFVRLIKGDTIKNQYGKLIEKENLNNFLMET